MTLKVYKPTNSLLKKYIECFYILEQTSEEKPATYFTFPSIYTIVTISEQTKTVEIGNRLIVKSCSSNAIETNLVSNFNAPVLVEYEGKINEITTYFKPLGINRFINHDLRYYSEGTFPEFNPHDDYKVSMISILSIKDHDEKIEKLESYWLSKLVPFEDTLLENILNEMMHAVNENQSMTNLSHKTARSRTTINKHFDKHICKTPSQFKKTLRFRSAIQSHLENEINLSHNLDYFDQSHMIRDFRSLTGFTPKAFFSKMSMLENDQIKWIFI